MAQIGLVELTPCGLAQDLALMVVLKAHLLSDEVHTATALNELKTFAISSCRRLPVSGGRNSLEATERTNEMDAAAVSDFSISNRAVLEGAISQQSVSEFNALVEKTSGGLIAALYRQEHLLSACLALAQLLNGKRLLVFVFEPETTSQSSRFLWSLFKPLAPTVTVLSTAPHDIIKAIRMARIGAVVGLAADVLTDIGSAISVPWNVGVRSVMTGAAYLSVLGRAAMIAATPTKFADGARDILFETVQENEHPANVLGFHLHTLALWRVFETQIAPPVIPMRPFPARQLSSQIRTAGQLRECLANMALSHTPLLERCPTFHALVAGK